jgi:hypothetical protein
LVESRRYAVKISGNAVDGQAAEDGKAIPPKREQSQPARGALGVSGWGSWTNSPEEFANEFQQRGLKPTAGKGLFIRSLNESHADGLRENDILIRVNGVQIVDDESWKKALATLRANEDAKLVLKRAEHGGPWKLITLSVKPLDGDLLARVQKQKEEEQRKKELEFREARQRTVFKLADGSTATGAEIDRLNERVRANLVRQVLTMDAEARFYYNRATDGLELAISLFESGDKKGLADLVSDMARNGVAKRIERTLFLQTDYDELLVCLKDGRAITYEELWGEVALEAARAMSR